MGDDNDGSGQDVRHQVDNVVHVAKESVDDIPTMVSLDALPFAPDELSEEELLHQVLSLHAQHGTDPGGGDVHDHLEQKHHGEHHSCPKDAPLFRMGGNVGERADGVHAQQPQSHH